jgi:DNA repair photolyase
MSTKQSEFKRPLMYADTEGMRVPTWTPHPGCLYKCSYCYGPATYARFSKCDTCKAFKPHFHKERMKQRFTKGKTYFVESLGDPSFIPPAIFQRILAHLATFPETTFMIQSKNPIYFKEFEYSTNVWLGTTIETNIDELAQQYSYAPVPSERYRGLLETMDVHPELNYYFTFEPIMRCSLDEMLKFALVPNIAAVYVGRDNHGNKLPEPSEEELMELVNSLTEALGKEKVHCKTLGPACWEKQVKK